MTISHLADSLLSFAAGDCILVRGEGEKQPFVRPPPSPLSGVKVHPEESEIAGRK